MLFNDPMIDNKDSKKKKKKKNKKTYRADVLVEDRIEKSEENQQRG